jgi:hypothetical protein
MTEAWVSTSSQNLHIVTLQTAALVLGHSAVSHLISGSDAVNEIITHG